MRLVEDVYKCYNVNVPNLVTYLMQSPIFEWYVFSCGFRIGPLKDMCSK